MNQQIREIIKKNNRITTMNNLYINSILLCNKPPILHGMWFYQKYINEFKKSYDYILKLYMIEKHREDKSLFNAKDYLDSNAHYIFNTITQLRPDLIDLYFEQSYGIEKLIIWAWIHGRHEMKIDHDKLISCIKTIYSLPYECAYDMRYNRLVHTVWLMRGDLNCLNFGTELIRQKQIINWFEKFGKYELGFDFIDNK